MVVPIRDFSPLNCKHPVQIWECPVLRLEQEHSRQQQLRPARCWRMRIYAWSKNTAGNSNYGLRGAGECCLVPITRFERTQLRIERCGAGKCCLVPTITKIERTQLRIERAVLENVVWCPKRDLNPHSCNSQRILSPSCLPIPPSGQKLLYLKRGNQ